MAQTTNYEVHVRQNGRWEIHARFSADEKEDAIEEAKSLDALKHIQSVKVIQEIYNPDDGTAKEINVYSPGQRKHRPAGKSSAAPPEEQTARPDTASAGESPKKKPVRLSFSALIVRILTITLFSGVVGGLFTWFVSMMTAGIALSESARTNIMTLTFLVTFVMAAIPMAIIFLNTKNT